MCSGCEAEYLSSAYPSTMSSPYFTGTLVEAVVEMFSCSGEYIGHGLLRSGGIGGKERWVRCNGVTGGRKGQRGEGRGLVLIEWSTGEKKEKKEGEGSAEPQLHPVMLHGSVSCSSTCSTLKSDKDTKISVFTHRQSCYQII